MEQKGIQWLWGLGGEVGSIDRQETFIERAYNLISFAHLKI